MFRIIGASAVAFVMAGASLTYAACTDDQAAAGEKVFRKCKTCHKIGEGASNGVGPLLTGIVGRPVASVEGYKYSTAMVEFGADGKVWTAELLGAYLTKPKDLVSGTKMAFAGLRKEDDRAELQCYFESLGADGVTASN